MKNTPQNAFGGDSDTIVVSLDAVPKHCAPSHERFSLSAITVLLAGNILKGVSDSSGHTFRSGGYRVRHPSRGRYCAKHSPWRRHSMRLCNVEHGARARLRPSALPHSSRTGTSCSFATHPRSRRRPSSRPSCDRSHRGSIQ